MPVTSSSWEQIFTIEESADFTVLISGTFGNSDVAKSKFRAELKFPQISGEQPLKMDPKRKI